MHKAELTTNLYVITNLEALCADFALFRVRGLDHDHEDYYRNRSQIEFELRRSTRSPACVFEDDMGLIAAVASDWKQVHTKLELVRTSIRLDALNESKALSFTNPDPCDRALCLNVLHFHFQEVLKKDGQLWQPGSGQPFFFKEPEATNRSLNLFRGFAVRPCLLPEGGFGIAVDVKHRYVHRRPLPSNLDRDGFRRWKGRKFIYHFGENWYEVRLDLFLGLTASEVEFSVGNGKVETLFDYVLRQSRRPLPKELTHLSPDDPAVAYFNRAGEQKSAPASLCYATDTSEHRDARQFEQQIKLRPVARLEHVGTLVQQYLASTHHNGMTVEVGSDAVRVERRTFAVPDLVFGGETVLSTRRAAGNAYVSLMDWGRKKKELLLDRNVGFLDQEPLGRQYLIFPQSVADSYGNQYVAEIRNAVDEWFPQDKVYQPRMVTYDDRGSRNVIDFGRYVMDAVDAANLEHGHGLVVVPRLPKAKPRDEDELASLVIRELFARGLTVAVSHTDVPDECFIERRSHTNGLEYVVDPGKRSKWKGYLRGLTLNKILLTNERWPFAFQDRLHADVTIGIDVKNNTAGFVLIGPFGRIIRMQCATSRRKERLAAEQIATEVMNLIKAEAPHLELGLSRIEIMRDGRLYEEEQIGIERAIHQLVEDGVVAADAQATLLEIHETSAMPFRLFDIFDRHGEQQVRNPRVGDFVISENDGFLCTTGWPFQRPGTSNPLHVKYLGGNLPFVDCLEDIFWLSCLSFTRPEDCSRLPVNLRLLDRRLREEAGEYDEDQLRYRSRSAQRASA
jgi:hypothetical protein